MTNQTPARDRLGAVGWRSNLDCRQRRRKALNSSLLSHVFKALREIRN